MVRNQRRQASGKVECHRLQDDTTRETLEWPSATFRVQGFGFRSAQNMFLFLASIASRFL